MKVWKLSMNEECGCKIPVAACIGYFDGLHKGHQALLKKAAEIAGTLQCQSALITFDPDPWVTIKGISSIKHLTTMNQRQHLAEKMGIEHFFILDFTKEMAALTPLKFMEFILNQIQLKALVCGFDFHYGARGAGNAETLKEYSKHRFVFYDVDSVDDESGKISSSRISDYIEAGQVEKAHALLGYPYTIEAKVIHGNAKGNSQLGFPTANCDVEKEFIIPKRGVYIGRVKVAGKDRPAMINIGHNPTFNERHMISIEAYILDFNENIYGLPIEVEFYQYIRKEQKFDSIEALIEQLKKDVSATASYFAHE